MKLKQRSDSQIEKHGHARFTPISCLLRCVSFSTWGLTVVNPTSFFSHPVLSQPLTIPP